MTQPALESINASMIALDASSGARLGGEVGSQASVSRSRCAKPLQALNFFASVDFPEPELPNTKTFLTVRNLDSTISQLARSAGPGRQIVKRFTSQY